MNLTAADERIWAAYEKANEKAKKRYYAHRDHIDGLQDCPACGGLTYAADGIHSLCKRNTEEKS